MPVDERREEGVVVVEGRVNEGRSGSVTSFAFLGTRHATQCTSSQEDSLALSHLIVPRQGRTTLISPSLMKFLPNTPQD